MAWLYIEGSDLSSNKGQWVRKENEPSMWRRLILMLLIIDIIACAYPNLKGCDNKVPSPPRLVPIA